MGKILTLEIPDDVYSSLKESSGEKNDREVSEQAVKILRFFLEKQNWRLNDPIFEPITTEGSGTVDTSERHDRYLYDS